MSRILLVLSVALVVVVMMSLAAGPAVANKGGIPNHGKSCAKGHHPVGHPCP